jgi:hypothetical protein
VAVGSGVPLTDSATLAGGFNPTGTIAFTLVGPGGGVVETEVVTVSGNGTYSTPHGFVPTAAAGAGTYHWVAAYSGDANNNPVTSPLGSEPETVTPASAAAVPPVASKRVFLASSLADHHRPGRGHRPRRHRGGKG